MKNKDKHMKKCPVCHGLPIKKYPTDKKSSVSTKVTTLFKKKIVTQLKKLI